VMSEESDDLRWFGVDEQPEDLDLAVRRMVEAAVDGHPM